MEPNDSWIRSDIRNHIIFQLNWFNNNIMSDIQRYQQELQKQKLTKLHQEVFGFKYNPTELVKNAPITKLIQGKIREMYLAPGVQPFHFCSYATFARVFPAPNIYEAYRAENLNIIDMHLRYHQFVHEKLAPFKWIPSLIVLAVTRLHPIGFVFPLIFTKRLPALEVQQRENNKHSKRIHAITQQTENCSDILRRVLLFDRLKADLGKQQDQIPRKYLKFGQNTQYVFHTTQKDVEQSSIYLTPVFQIFMNIKSINLDSVKEGFASFQLLLKQLKQFNQIKNRSQLPIFIDREKLLKFKDVKKEQIYNLSKQIELRIRRMVEVVKYAQSGKIFMSGFTFTDALHLNKHYDLLAPHKFNLETNMPDLTLFYGTTICLGILKFIIKRSIKM